MEKYFDLYISASSTLWWRHICVQNSNTFIHNMFQVVWNAHTAHITAWYAREYQRITADIHCGCAQIESEGVCLVLHKMKCIRVVGVGWDSMWNRYLLLYIPTSLFINIYVYKCCTPENIWGNALKMWTLIRRAKKVVLSRFSMYDVYVHTSIYTYEFNKTRVYMMLFFCRKNRTSKLWFFPSKILCLCGFIKACIYLIDSLLIDFWWWYHFWCCRDLYCWNPKIRM